MHCEVHGRYTPGHFQVHGSMPVPGADPEYTSRIFTRVRSLRNRVGIWMRVVPEGFPPLRARHFERLLSRENQISDLIAFLATLDPIPPCLPSGCPWFRPCPQGSATRQQGGQRGPDPARETSGHLALPRLKGLLQAPRRHVGLDLMCTPGVMYVEYVLNEVYILYGHDVLPPSEGSQGR